MQKVIACKDAERAAFAMQHVGVGARAIRHVLYAMLQRVAAGHSAIAVCVQLEG
jgi:hypothetical protein